MFVPLTYEQADEAGIELSYDSVVCLNSAVERLKGALREFNCKG